MSYVERTSCADLAAAGFDAQRAAEETWEALLSIRDDVFVTDDHIFASGQRATLKVDAEALYEQPKQLEVILGHFASFPCVVDADALLYVPYGWEKFMKIIGRELDIPVVGAIRHPMGRTRYDFMFETRADEELALAAEQPTIGEDVVTTLGSVDGIRRLLKPEQNVHSLAMLLRDEVNPEYRVGLTDHYLLERRIPLDAEEFYRTL